MTNSAIETKPAAKKPRISQFRRALWHINRTDLGWLVKGGLSLLNLGKLRQRRALISRLPKSAALSQASQSLEQQGFLDVSDIVSRALAEAVATHAEAKLAKADALSGQQELGHKSFWVSLLDEDLRNGAYPSSHPFVQYALQPGVLSILAGYMNQLPQLSDVLLTLSRPTESKLTFSQLWHHDHDDKRVCKLFIYLSDVESLNDGPFTFMDAQSSNRFKNARKSHMTDERVFSRVGKDAVHELIAPKFSSFIVDTARCLHMGSRITPGHTRLLYTATYFPPPRIYPEPKPRFYEDGPIDPVSQAALAP